MKKKQKYINTAILRFSKEVTAPGFYLLQLILNFKFKNLNYSHFCKQPTANCQLPTANCQLFIANCLPPAFNSQLKRILNLNSLILNFIKAIILTTTIACNSTTDKKQTTYICPMFCDSLVYDAPGLCKVCGMDLVKLEEHQHDTDKKNYTCPMHPEIKKDKPGKCPICGMDLVEKMETTEPSSQNTGKLNLGDILLPVNESVVSGVKTIHPTQEAVSFTVSALGYITYNPQNTQSVASRFGGRIEKLYIKYNFQRIEKGQKLMDIYSPELITAQENLLFLYRSDSTNIVAINYAKKQLLLLGMNSKQLNDLIQNGKSTRTISIYAPFSGHIHEMENLKDLTMPIMEMQSGNSGMKEASSKQFSIREGMYIEKGKTLFSIIGTEKLWAILKIYPEDIAKVKLNQPVTIYSESQKERLYRGKINFIEPNYESDSKYLNARVYLDNCDHHKIKIGSLIKATVETGNQKGLWVPESAILKLGNDKEVVFLKAGNTFSVSRVKTGSTINNKTEIKGGLTAKDEIAENGQFLVDSEGFVRSEK